MKLLMAYRASRVTIALLRHGHLMVILVVMTLISVIIFASIIVITIKVSFQIITTILRKI